MSRASLITSQIFTRPALALTFATVLSMACSGTVDTGETGGGGAGGTAAGGKGGTGGTGPDCGAAGPGLTGPCAPECSANQAIESQCIAIADNAGLSTYGLRMAQLTLTKPAALTNPIILGLLDDSVTMNLPDCNLTGQGTLSWLLQFDAASGKLKMGGARPTNNPAAGYCFANQVIGGVPIAPVEVDASADACGTFGDTAGGAVAMPIFFDDAGTDALILPLRNAKIVDATVSPDHNCIGRYNAEKLQPGDSCEPSAVQRFENGARIDAHITLKDADAVSIESLQGQTLCVLLTGEGEGLPKSCKKDPATGEITSKGDWCSTTDMPADAACADAFKLTGQFAASAVKINGNCP